MHVTADQHKDHHQFRISQSAFVLCGKKKTLKKTYSPGIAVQTSLLWYTMHVLFEPRVLANTKHAKLALC